MRWCVAIDAAVVHVDVHIAAPPSLGWKVGNALESYTLRDSHTRRHVHVGTKNPILGPRQTSTCTVPAGTVSSAVPLEWK